MRSNIFGGPMEKAFKALVEMHNPNPNPNPNTNINPNPNPNTP